MQDASCGGDPSQARLHWRIPSFGVLRSAVLRPLCAVLAPLLRQRARCAGAVYMCRLCFARTRDGTPGLPTELGRVRCHPVVGRLGCARYHGALLRTRVPGGLVALACAVHTALRQAPSPHVAMRRVKGRKEGGVGGCSPNQPTN